MQIAVVDPKHICSLKWVPKCQTLAKEYYIYYFILFNPYRILRDQYYELHFPKQGKETQKSN